MEVKYRWTAIILVKINYLECKHCIRFRTENKEAQLRCKNQFKSNLKNPNNKFKMKIENKLGSSKIIKILIMMRIIHLIGKMGGEAQLNLYQVSNQLKIL